MGTKATGGHKIAKLKSVPEDSIRKFTGVYRSWSHGPKTLVEKKMAP